MAIFRGIGGAGDSTTDATLSAVTEQATNAVNSATAAASSASSASTSASNASTSATNAAASASAASTSETNAAASEAAASASETAAAASEAAAAASAASINPDSIDINGGTIDGTVIGGTTAAAGTFASLTSTGGLTVTNDATVNDVTVGRGNYDAIGNTALGAYALTTNASGTYNTAVGESAMYYVDTGSYNTAVGASALSNATSASNSVAIGYNALVSNISGTDNLAVGNSALQNSTASFNTAVGTGALYQNSTGTLNTANGYAPLNKNTTGSYNTGIGTYALYNNTTASNNTAVGYRAGYSNTTGGYNVAVGNDALQANNSYYSTAVGNTSGYSSTTGSSNNSFGFQALYSTTTGTNNTAIGNSALYLNTVSSDNTAVGNFSLYNSNTTGSTNTAVGYKAGYYITTGSKNTILGSYDGNEGGLDIRTSSNYIVLSDGDGNPRQVIDNSGNVGIGTTSPTAKLDVNGTVVSDGLTVGGATALATIEGSTNARIVLKDSGAGTDLKNIELFTVNGRLEFNSPSDDGLTSKSRIRLDNNGDISFYEDTGTTAKFFWDASAESLGIGTSSPAYPLAVSGAGSVQVQIRAGNTSDSVLLFGDTDSAAIGRITYAHASDSMVFTTNSVTRATIDSSGNLGLGVTPSAWASNYRALDFNHGALSQGGTGAGSIIDINYNCYFNGTNWIYKNSDEASQYRQAGGIHYWYTAPSGTAGNNISFTQAMTLTASGRLGIGTSSPASTLDVRGIITIDTKSDATNPRIVFDHDNFAAINYIQVDRTSDDMQFIVNGGERARIDSSGNVGLGVTPSAWSSIIKPIQIANAGSSLSASTTSYSSGNHLFLTNNGYQDGSNWVYSRTATAAQYYQQGNEHRWYNAPSGTAGNAISFTQAMTLDASGNLGIGTSSPSQKLHINGNTRVDGILMTNGGSAAAPTHSFSGDLNTGLFGTGGDVIGFSTGGSERARITSSGNVGIGTTSPSNALEVYTTSVFGGITVSGPNAPGLTFNDTTDAAYCEINTQNAGDLRFYADQSNVGLSTTMEFHIDGSEAMRIDSSGNLLVGTTSLGTIGSTAGIGLYADGRVLSSNVSNGSYFARMTTDGAVIYFRKDTTTVGSISVTGSATAYNTSSDYRLKENVVGVTGAAARVQQLNPVRFNFIVDPDTTVDGFLAHEVQDVVPEAISGIKDEVDAEGNPVYQGIDQSKLVPLLTAALQEALAEINTLKSRLDAAGL